jgi:hypothetical protein
MTLRNAEILAALAVDREIAHLHAELEALELRAQLRAVDWQREYNAATERWCSHRKRELVSARDWALFCSHYYQHERHWQPQRARA